MRIQVEDLRSGTTEVEIESTVLHLLAAIGESDQTVIVSVNNRIVTADHKLSKTDKIKVIPVVSGG